ncbi:MAG: cyclic nucleotide-binding domain-containing protein [Spirochaetota bacterium]|nr:cyclic nucleotide-binding domain-containing protein [Spirochaetota bacterium]
MSQPKGIIENSIINKLKEVSFFRIYSEDDEVINMIAKLCTRRRFKKGTIIIKESDYGDELFIIYRGEIDIVKRTLQNEEYTVTTLNSEMEGICVGELALIDNDKRSATVTANTDCECLVINRDAFIKFGNEHPEIGLNITRAIAGQLSSKLRKTNADVITLFSALVEEIAGYE